MLGAIASLKKKYRARSRMRMSMTGGGTPGAGTGQRAFQSMMVETTGRDGPADGGGGDKENGAGISIRKAGSPLDIEFLRGREGYGWLGVCGMMGGIFFSFLFSASVERGE